MTANTLSALSLALVMTAATATAIAQVSAAGLPATARHAPAADDGAALVAALQTVGRFVP